MAKKNILYPVEVLMETLLTLDSILNKCKKSQTKFNEGSSQYTLLHRRINALTISRAFVAEALSKVPALPLCPNEENCSPTKLLTHLDLLHTTTLGEKRIRKNLNLLEEDLIVWCQEQISSPEALITRQGKNWYITLKSCKITINAHRYTLITAHPIK